MNTSNLFPFVESLALVPRDAKNHNPPYLLIKMLQEDGSTRWKVSQNSSSCLCRAGFFCIEYMPSNRTPEHLDDTRFNSIEEACSFFQLFINTQTNPEHPNYIRQRFVDFEFIQMEFNRFLNALEINI